MRIPPVLRQPTLWLVLAPLLALALVVGVTRLGGGSPAEERAARTATTTSTTTTSTTTPGGEAVTPPSAPAAGSGSAAAEVLGVQEDSAFSESESLAGVGFDDGGATEVLGEQFVALDLTSPAPDPVTPPTTTPPPAPTTVPVTTTTTTVPSTTGPTTTPTTTTTTTPPPSVQVQSRTVLLQMTCSVFDPTPGAIQPPAVTGPVTVGVSTLTAVPAGRGLPVLLGLLGPTNLLGEVLREQLVESVRISASGSGATPLQLTTANPLPLSAGAVVPIPDGGDDFLAGTFPVSASAGSNIALQIDSVSFSRQVDGRTLEQRCDVVPGTSAQLANVAVVSESTPTTTIVLPDPVVPESPFTALLPISAVVVGGAALALLVRRRRTATSSIDQVGP
ncbi:MAG: hypothetical protein ACOYOQ_06020 [Microthrixaceae bacterium]